MPKLSANLGFLWPELTLLERIKAAASARFRAVELHWPYCTPPSAIREACAANGLTLLGLNTAIGDAAKGEFGLGALPGREAEFQATVDEAIAYCLESGATSIHAMAGIVEASKRGEARATFLQNLESAARKADDSGLTLLLEPINQCDKLGYFYSRAEEAVSIIEELGAPNVKLMFDIYHVGVSEGDVLRKLERYLPLIGHIQIAAVPSRAEPDEGEIAYERVLQAIDDSGYAGWVGCEYKPRAGTDCGLTWIERLGLSRM
jgi:hydroxypyruvate isomerase